MTMDMNYNDWNVRKLCWDEENRLMGVADDNFISYYMYDAGGERTYKLTGAFQDMVINGQQYNYNLMNNPTLYTSPYLVATPQGYTKHFYAGSERILSKIGCGGLDKLEDPIKISPEEIKSAGSKASSQPPEEPDPEPAFTPIEDKILNSNYLLKRTLECLEKDPEIIWDNLIKLYDLEEVQCEEEEHLYYYHPDHLGSGTWITYTDGEAIQHLHYLPFGEEQIDQRLTSFNSRYTFSAKEKDVETSYSYFGARYYTSDLSIWLSVDPLSDKYPSLSPYAYCANNPVMLTDPYGLSVEGDPPTKNFVVIDGRNRPNDEALQKNIEAVKKLDPSVNIIFAKNKNDMINQIKFIRKSKYWEPDNYWTWWIQ